MTRKRKILVIQISIFIISISLLFFTYYEKDKSILLNTSQSEQIESTNENASKSNAFEDIEYKGVDFNGNRYSIRSEQAEFELDTPELINMKVMKATFYFKDGTVLNVSGDYGVYNNKTNDMIFKENIEAIYENNYLYADNLDYLNSKSLLSIYGNVRTESIQGSIIADNLKFDLSSQTLDVTMFSDKQVNVELKKK
mgnify:FL=1